MATLSPASAKARAMARPMPRLPPVTRTERLKGPPSLVEVHAGRHAAPVRVPTLALTKTIGLRAAPENRARTGAPSGPCRLPTETSRGGRPLAPSLCDAPPRRGFAAD